MAPIMMQLQASGRPCRCTAAPCSRRSLRRLRVTAEGAAAAAPAEAPKKERRVSPLEAGGTLKGPEAAGKDAGAAAKSAVAGSEAPQKVLQLDEGRFVDYRWTDGRWDLTKFASAGGKMDWEAWNKVIDAEMARRKLLEESPIPSTNEEPVFFDTAEIPWWAWVRRFHLPEAEKLNGRAAMVGYFLAYFVDQLTGAGLADQQNSFLGKLALHVVVFAILIFRTSNTIPMYKNLLDEATFYDRQWAATWEGQARPSETEKS